MKLPVLSMTSRRLGQPSAGPVGGRLRSARSYGMANRPYVSPEDQRRADALIVRQRAVWGEMTSIDATSGDGAHWRELRDEMNGLMDQIAAILQGNSDPPV